MKKLSIIVPCYNCSKTIERLLDSILENKLDRNCYEVILCDDKSTDNFMDIVNKKYLDKMDIVPCTTTREFHCPGNTRQAGLNHATGEWITFIDNDDMFEKDGLVNALKVIEEEKLQYTLVTSFHEYDVDTNTYVKEFFGENADTWTHGKFYNRINLVERFGLHFREDQFSHEDLYWNTTAIGFLINNNKDFFYKSDLFTYKWVVNKESLSRSYFNTEHFYIEEYLQDYIVASSHIYFDLYGDRMKDFCTNQILMTLLHAYFYMQAFKYRLGEKILSKNISYIHDFKSRVNNELRINDYEIINYVYSDPIKYNNIKIKSFDGSNPFIESQSFRDFILNI